ncbi:hypothetical protein SAMN04487861_10539 [Selenomonas ruminantium]|jgi:hypothetical protein|uniref:Uncharacterized protein n=1 Tax=Selenomonas ruminantium TaxID=971 RepID=A0A1I3D1Q2_SELRU|nr:hypothetical protein [Selenomonas ruminantium]SFH80538.1 hypothetical protein SAMN04487861_10539 [Selenomonas ruminantium]
MDKKRKKIKELSNAIEIVITEMEKKYSPLMLDKGSVGMIYKRYKRIKKYICEGGDPFVFPNDFCIVGGVYVYLDITYSDIEFSSIIYNNMCKTEKIINEETIIDIKDIKCTDEDICESSKRWEEKSRKEQFGYLGLDHVVSNIPTKEETECGYFIDIYINVKSKSLFGEKSKKTFGLKEEWPMVFLGRYKYPATIDDVLNDIKKMEEGSNG